MGRFLYVCVGNRDISNQGASCDANSQKSARRSIDYRKWLWSWSLRIFQFDEAKMPFALEILKSQLAARLTVEYGYEVDFGDF